MITRYGEQEGAEVGYNSKKKGRASHHPNIAFLSGTKYVVNFWNRPGNSSSANGVTGFLIETLSRLGNKITLKGCICDSGFYKIDLIKHLDSIGVEYIIGVPFFQILQRAIAKDRAWNVVEKGLCVSEFMFQHKDEKWDKDRRYILVRQEKGVREVVRGKQLKLFKEGEEISNYRYNCFVTSFSDSPVEIWRSYRKRAGDENIIKESTHGFGLEGFSLDSFYSTEAAMLIRILFYNIINFFRNEILPEQERKSTINTLRYKYLVIPAQLGTDGRKMILRLGVKMKAHQEKIKWILRRIDEYFKIFSKCTAVGTG